MYGKHKQRMLDGEPHLFRDPEIMADYHACKLLLKSYNDSSYAEPELRRKLLGELLGGYDGASVVEPPFHCDLGYNITIGSETVLNYDTTILDCAPVTIGNRVAFGPGVKILTATHPVVLENRMQGWTRGLPVTIEDGVWLAAGVIVFPGVTIGAGTVVSAGSIVRKNLPPNSLVAGNPARVIRPLPEVEDLSRWPGIDEE